MRFAVLLAGGLCLAAPASALGADVAAPVTQTTAGAAQAAPTSAQTISAPTSSDNGTGATEQTQAASDSAAQTVSDTGSPVGDQSGGNDGPVSPTGSTVDKAVTTASSLGDSLAEAGNDASRNVTSVVDGATRAAAQTRRDAEPTIGSTTSGATETADSAGRSVQQVIDGAGSNLPPSGGSGVDGGGIALPSATLPDLGSGAGITTPAPTLPDGGGGRLIGDLLPLSSNDPSAGAAPSADAIAPVTGMLQRRAPSLAGRLGRPQPTLGFDSLLASPPVLLTRIFSLLGATMTAADLPALASAGGGAPGAPTQGPPPPFALPSLGGGLSNSTLLLEGLLALLTVFFLSAPGLGRWIRTSAEKWPPPGLVSPIEVPG